MPVILLIDDDINVRRSFRFFLEKGGHSVLEAENGEAGVELFQRQNPDLLIVDLQMPVMDGFDVLKIVTRQSPDTSIIVVSGNNVIEDAVKAVQLGAWDYLLKPVYDMKVLNHAVDKGLERSRLIRENRAYQQGLENLVAKRTTELEIAIQKLRETNAQLRISEEKLQRANIDLEKRVAERTRELEEMNAALTEAKKAADTAALAKSTFLANMSHEIRTPMNGVIAATDLAMREQMPAKVVDYLKIIQSSGRMLLDIVNDILDFSKIEAGKLELEVVPFDINEIVENVIAQFVPKANEKGITLIVDMAPQIHLWYRGDSLRIQQVLNNLVSNAIKFTNEFGAVTLGISDSERESVETEQGLLFYVKDTGIGIPKDQQDKLFHPFSQADSSTTRKFGGTGLGLSICKQLVELMEGKIWVESTPHAGTTFFFTINLEVSAGEKKENKAQSLTLENAAQIRGLNILVVEDNLTNQKIATAILENAGINAAVVNNGKEALDELRRSEYDVVLMDIQMPEMDGYETTERIRRELKVKDLPIIAMTADVMKGTEEKCLAVGMDGYITKPINGEELLHIINEKTAIGRPVAKAPMGKKDVAEQGSVDGIAVEDMISQLGFDVDTIKEILESFYKSNTGTNAKLKEYYHGGNWHELWRSAHTLKGAGANIRAYKLEKVAKELEDAAHDIVDGRDQTTFDPGMIDTVRAELDIVINSIKNYL